MRRADKTDARRRMCEDHEWMRRPLNRLRMRLGWAKLNAVVRMLNTSKSDDLRDVAYVAQLICRAGVVFDERALYGVDNRFMTSGPFGLWQIPTQLARCLVELSRYEIGSFIEIGTWLGWTVTFVSAYLRRFNPWLAATTVDVGDCRAFFRNLLIPMRVHQGTSEDFRGQRFNLVFIDGDHSYRGCAADYDNLGRHADICMFHDVNDRFVAEYIPNEGGVPRFWVEVKAAVSPADRVFEYLDHSESDRIMGIGLIVRPTAVERPQSDGATLRGEMPRTAARGFSWRG